VSGRAELSALDLRTFATSYIFC